MLIQESEGNRGIRMCADGQLGYWLVVLCNNGGASFGRKFSTISRHNAVIDQARRAIRGRDMATIHHIKTVKEIAKVSLLR